jgi:V8-like Glu-specific endopeptidase
VKFNAIQRTLITSITVAVLATTTSSAQSSQGVAQKNQRFVVDRAKVLVFDTKTIALGPYSSTLATGDDPIRWTRPIVAPAGVKEISIHLKVASAGVTQAWEIRFRDLNGKEIDVVAADSPRGREGDFWSDDIPGNGALVEVWATEVPTGLTVVIDSYSIPTVPSVPQAIYGEDQRVSINATPPDVQKLGTPVARLRIKDSRGEARCTGFLISDDLILTNFHCVSRNSQAVGTNADFGFDSPNAKWKTFRGAKLELVNTDEGLDYAIIRLLGKPGSEFGHVPLRDKAFAALDKGYKLLLIEHAAGQAKQASITDCAVGAKLIAGVNLQLLSDFGHHCDTLGGSSGSPVFDLESRELLGLHHLGFDEQNSTAQGKPSSTAQIDNQAVYIEYIVQDIHKQSQGLFDELIGSSH